MTFHDPTVGSGGMLIEAARYYRDQGGDPTKLTFTGQEINPDIAAIAKMNLSIHGLEGEIEREDSLSSPAFTDEENSELTRFDRVLANFPFSADWAKDDLQDDPYGRFDWHEKLPRADRGDYAFIMHMAKQLYNPNKGDEHGGKAAIVIPNGVLFRSNEGRYRRPMVDNGYIDAIVTLPDNLFQNVSIPTSILVLNTNKENAEEIAFISATAQEFYREKSSQSELTMDGIEHIIHNYRNKINESGVSRVVGIEEIESNDYNLDTSLYVDTTEDRSDVNVVGDWNELAELQKRLREHEEKLNNHLEALNYE
jgi:type I restriction enzyme M protein